MDKKPKGIAMVDRPCKCCGKMISVRAADVARGWGNYCSRACAKKTPGGDNSTPDFSVKLPADFNERFPSVPMQTMASKNAETALPTESVLMYTKLPASDPAKLPEYVMHRDISGPVREELVSVLRHLADVIELGAVYVSGGLMFNMDDTKGNATLHGDITFQVMAAAEIKARSN